jgi:COMPASS component SPP1
MATGDLGYGRVEPPVVVATSPRRPGSGSGRRQLNVADLVVPERVPTTEVTREVHLVLSPPGRRSPPGSQSGRAKAARKSEEGVDPGLGLKEHVPQIVPERGRQPSPQEEHKRPKEDRKKFRSAEVPSKIKEPLHRPPSVKAREEDAHEWFLEHYDEYPPIRNEPPRLPSPVAPTPVASVIPAHRVSKSPAPKKLTPTPNTMPEAAVALEQELEALMAEPPAIVSKVEPDLDIDVDLAVTELVAETLDAEPAKQEEVGMEVDVEDELLSLVDDRPLQPSRRASSSGNGSSSTKPPPLRPVSDSDPHRASPTVTSAHSPSGFLSPAVRPSSTRPTSERGSMPPPAFVAPGRGKDKDDKKGERAGSVAATATLKKKATKVRP